MCYKGVLNFCEYMQHRECAGIDPYFIRPIDSKLIFLSLPVRLVILCSTYRPQFFRYFYKIRYIDKCRPAIENGGFGALFRPLPKHNTLFWKVAIWITIDWCRVLYAGPWRTTLVSLPYNIFNARMAESAWVSLLNYILDWIRMKHVMVP